MENHSKFEKRAAEIFDKYQSGTLSEEEHALLLTWYRTYADPSVEKTELSDKEIAEMHARLLDRLGDRQHKIETPLWKKKLPYVAAASIFIALAISLYQYFYTVAEDPFNTALTDEVQPGGSRAYWITPEGDTLNLATSVDNPSAIVTIDEQLGVITFSLEDSSTANLTPRPQTITTPVGGEYTVILSDGSTVKLNSNSSLTFTHPFTAQREVNLQGEGYFDVTRNPSKPFVVNTNYQHIEVLGTTFNIKSYSEDQLTTTSLIAGKLRVSSDDRADVTSVILAPGEKAQSGTNQILTVIRPQEPQTIAWQRGDFQFDGENLEEVLHILSRWYDVEIRYERTSPSKVRFGGAISRNRNLSDVLKILKVQENFTYEVRGKQVIIK